MGAQYRSGIYYYNETQACLAEESKDAKQLELKEKIVTEILPAKRFYKAEEYHQQTSCRKRLHWSHKVLWLMDDHHFLAAHFTMSLASISHQLCTPI